MTIALRTHPTAVNRFISAGWSSYCEFIESNQRLRDEIEALPKKQNSELILAKVSEINGVCSEILARIDIFSGMAATLPPTRILSAQAIDIIRIFYTAPGADQLS